MSQELVSPEQVAFQEQTFNPLDFDLEKRKGLFEALLSTPLKIVEITKAAYQKNGNQFDSQSVPISEQPFLTGNYYYTDEYGDREVPIELIPNLEDLINNHPEIVLSLDIPTEKRGAIFDRKPRPNRSLPSIEERAAAAKKKQELDQKRKLFFTTEPIASALKCNYDELSNWAASSILKDLESAQTQLRETIYWQTTLYEAAKLIIEIAPSLREKVSTIITETPVIIVSKGLKLIQNKPLRNRSTFSDTNNWMIEGRNSAVSFRKTVVVESANSDQLHGPDHVMRLLIVAHELMHVITQELLDEISPEEKSFPSIRRIGEKIKQMLTGVKSASINISNLLNTLHESISLALEHEVITRALEQTKGQEEQDELKSWGETRLQFVRESNLDDPNNKESRLAYSEGTRLAIALRRNGWQISDLPDLLQAINNVVQPQPGQTLIETLLSASINKGKDGENSRYQSFLKAIRSLKKNET